MDVKARELGPYEPVPDLLVLAAIERAARHGTEPVWIATLGEHLGFRHAPHNTRHLRHQLEGLQAKHSWVDSQELHGREYWHLTSAGHQELEEAQGADRVEELPESPQHRAWRHARAGAVERIGGFRQLTYDAVEDAERVMATRLGTNPSPVWFALGERVSAALWLVGAAIRCIEEWPEPDDARPDVDPDPHLAPGRRSTSAWDEKEAKAKGGQR